MQHSALGHYLVALPDLTCLLLPQADQQTVEFWRLHNPEAVAMVQRHYEKHPGVQTASRLLAPVMTVIADHVVK